MEEIKNFKLEEVKEIAKDFPWKPLANRVIITINTVERDKDEVVLSDESFSEEQFVIAAGPMAERFVKSGDTILLDVEKMTVRNTVDHDQYQTVPQIKIDPLYTEYGTFAMVNDSYIKAVKND